ncbi:hypothetical protein ACIBKY_25380 [Nonomuraea sp. NPDC050394]|uniref:hypothetical protein n=1 Tax=Nonomuraea sp. NPDC050394 TaxID=3364363 RepID=UPI0037A3FB6D
MSLRRWRAVSALVLLAGAACACSAKQAGAPPKLQPRVAVPEARRLVLPFDAYNFSPAEIMTLEVADDLLVGDCMRERGFAWQALPGPAESEIAPPHRRRYGVIEPEVADVFGYHFPADRPAVAAYKSRDLETRITGAPPKVRDAAGECLDRARDRLTARVPEADGAFFSETIYSAFDASQRDEKVTRAFRAWSACMAGEGFHYPDPLAAITDRRWSTKAPSALEIRAARADVTCKARTGLVSTWAAAEERIQNDAIRTHPKKFQALRSVKTAQLEAARQVIAAR